MRSCGLPLVLAALGMVAPPQTAQRSYRVAVEWETVVSALPPSSVEGLHLFSTTALCPSGAVYVIGPGGKALTVTPGGRASASQVLSLPELVASAACDAGNRLYVLGHEALVFAPGPAGRLRRTASVPLHVTAARLFTSRDGSVYALGYDRALLPVVISIPPAGGDPRTFWARRRLASPPPGVGLTATGLAWEDSQGRVTYVPSGLLNADFLRDSGEYFSADALPGPAPTPGFGLNPVVALPAGRFVGVLSRESEFADIYRADLEILDASLHPVAPPIRLHGLGHLLGASKDGALYFLGDGDERVIRLARASLIVVTGEEP